MPIEMRQIEESERDRYVDICCYSFGGTKDEIERWLSLSRPEDSWGLYVDGTLTSCLQILPFSLGVAGGELRAGGIANVATAPDWRGRGHAHQLMRTAIEVMRERGEPVSVLYPFSYAYYRRVGWALAGARRQYTLDPTRLPAAPEARDVIRSCSEEDIPLFEAPYDAMRGRYSCMLKRDDRHWKRHVLRQKRMAFFQRVPEGAGAYMILSWETIPATGGRRIRIAEWGATDPRGRRALLGFLRLHYSQTREILMPAPPDDDLWEYLPDPNLTTRLEPTFMLRVVDLPAAMRSRGYRSDLDATLILRVVDHHAQWNTGAWSLRLRGGRADVETSSDDADLRCDITTLSQLFCGYLLPSQALALGKLEAPNREAVPVADKIFRAPPTFMWDTF